VNVVNSLCQPLEVFGRITSSQRILGPATLVATDAPPGRHTLRKLFHARHISPFLLTAGYLAARSDPSLRLNTASNPRSAPLSNASFDIVSKVDRQEIDNALNQAIKELSQRFDFKNTGASIEWQGEMGVEIRANSEERAKAALDVFKDKLVKRKVSLKHLEAGEPQLSGKEYRITGTLTQGISQDNAKKIAKIIRDEGPKAVKPLIQGDELRVTSKSRDDLQAVQTLLNGKDLDVALQYVNYR
jgi:uncharacterized protein YajQ (UPF0234 family)